MSENVNGGEVMSDQKVLKEWDRETPTHHIHCVKVEYICWCCNGTGEHQDSGDRDVNDYIYCHRCYARDLESSCEGTVRCLECKGTGQLITTRTTKWVKYLCIGGPCDGATMTADIAGKDYEPYNRAQRGNERRGQKPEYPQVILIHKTILKNKS